MRLILDAIVAHEIQPVPDRAEGIPELVREDREKFVLHAVRALHLLLGDLEHSRLLL